MSIADQKLREIREQVQSHFASVPRRRDAELTTDLEDCIRAQLEAHNAVIVAHYYTAPEIQARRGDRWLRIGFVGDGA